jgi:hypothetical protein
MTTETTMNRYDTYAAETATQIKVLRARIENFKNGPRAHRISAIEAEIAKLEKNIKSLKGTAAIIRDMYGE